MGDRRDRGDIEHFAARIAHGFSVDQLGFRPNCRREIGGFARIDQRGRHPKARQGIGEKIVRSPVQGAR